ARAAIREPTHRPRPKRATAAAAKETSLILRKIAGLRPGPAPLFSASSTRRSSASGGATSRRNSRNADLSAELSSSSDSFIPVSFGRAAEAPAHRLARARKLALGRSRVDLEQPRDLFVREAFDIVKQQHCSEAMRQPSDGSLQVQTLLGEGD